MTNKLYGIYDKISNLINTSGSNDKQALLEKYKDDESFRFVISFLLNPYLLTRISTKKINKKINLEAPTHNDIFELIIFLTEKSTGKDLDVKTVQNFINKYEDEDIKKFLIGLVTKNLKLGFTAKTVNKVYGKDTIPSFAVMLAEGFDKKHAKITGKFYVTLKLDGNRCVVVKENGKVKFFTRKGLEIEGLTQLGEQFKNLPDNYVYDGELLLKNVDNLTSDALFTASQKVIRKDGEKKDLEFHMFDILPLKEFKNGKSVLKYFQRRNILESIVSPLVNSLGEEQLIHVLPVLYEGDDKSVIPLIVKSVEENGFEGVMVNTADGLYQTKRVNDLQKVKTMKTADLLVMSLEKAIDGKHEGIMGRVNVEYKGNLVGVGGGYSDEQRKQFAENPDLIVGKIIEVQFFEESKDEKTGLPSLRFPVFKGIRHDKGVEDINYG